MLKIVKGDDVKRSFRIVNDGKVITNTVVSHIYFSSSALNITSELTYNSTDKEFVLSLSKSQTAAFTPGTYSFDLTMDSTGGDRNTLIYEDTVLVVPKNNTVTDVSDDE